MQIPVGMMGKVEQENCCVVRQRTETRIWPRYFVSMPPSGRCWPIVIAVDGAIAHAQFEPDAKTSLKAWDDLLRPYLV